MEILFQESLNAEGPGIQNNEVVCFPLGIFTFEYGVGCRGGGLHLTISK
jgi:hypothetical protein